MQFTMGTQFIQSENNAPYPQQDLLTISSIVFSYAHKTQPSLHQFHLKGSLTSYGIGYSCVPLGQKPGKMQRGKFK